MDSIVTGFGLIGIVLIIAALMFGVVQRAPVSFPIIFLGLGVVLGPQALGVITIDSHSPVLEIIATLSLAFVLFLDAVRLDLGELRRGWFVPILILGPGTVLVIGVTAATGAWLLGLSLIPALMVAATLSSTDPVVLRDVVRHEGLPAAIRQALTVEAGTNDLVVLPILLVLIAIATQPVKSGLEWGGLLAQLFLLGPIIGFAIGGVGSWLVGAVDRRIPIGREYQALYGVGLVLTAYVGGTLVGGDGFLAAFFAGLAVSVFNNQLCDCFLDYGEITAEMTMLLAFILFGAVISTLIPLVAVAPALLLGVVAIVLIRPLILTGVLLPARMSQSARAFIGWFGPRGLNSLLFGLLLVRAGVPDADGLLGIIGVVVALSVVVHGVSATPLSAWYVRKARGETLEEERAGSLDGLFRRGADGVHRASPAELRGLMDGDPPPIVLDVRSRSQYRADKGRIPGDVRVELDDISAWAESAPKDRLIAAYCT